MAFGRTASVAGFSPVPRVNLLPRTEIERRERSALVRRWLVGVVVALLVVAAASAGTYALNVLAGARLAAENARTTTLLSQLSSLSDVSKTQAVETDLQAYRTLAMGADVAWTPVFHTLENLVPGNAKVTGWDLTTGALPAKGDAAGQVGITANITLASSTPIDIVATARAMRTAKGVIDADAVELTGAAEGSGAGTGATSYTYQLSATLDQSVYTGLYAAKEK